MLSTLLTRGIVPAASLHSVRSRVFFVVRFAQRGTHTTLARLTLSKQFRPQCNEGFKGSKGIRHRAPTTPSRPQARQAATVFGGCQNKPRLPNKSYTVLPLYGEPRSASGTAPPTPQRTRHALLARPSFPSCPAQRHASFQLRDCIERLCGLAVEPRYRYELQNFTIRRLRMLSGYACWEC